MAHHETPPNVLCIGGHDPSGGAGILADAESVRAAGAFALTVITALTEQDTLGLRAIYPQPPEQVEAQCRALMEDGRPRALKVGLVGSSRIVRVLGSLIDGQPDLPLVLDPVLASNAGQEMVDAALLNQLRNHLVRRATLVTPNLPEACTLADSEEPGRCARRLMEIGARWVLVTGTHDLTTRDVVNRLYAADGAERTWSWPRLPGEYHGSGCTLASAIAARLALGWPMVEAVTAAQEYTWTSLKQALATGRGQLTPNRLFAMTRIAGPP
jgi:hydroxymethylpyrimidine/phosphomethylpyrimidine kinase